MGGVEQMAADVDAITTWAAAGGGLFSDTLQPEMSGSR